ncbi:MAG: flagellar hook-associated family protein [Pseudaminobacter sp.]
MKAFFVSSSAVSEALRYSVMRSQAALVKAQKEATTGLVADTGLALGARTSQTVSFARELERIKAIADTNAVITSRLTATQEALNRVADLAQSLLSTLTTNLSGTDTTQVSVAQAKSTLSALGSILNTNLDGQYLFAGINTDQKPFASYEPGSAPKAAYDAAFAQYLADTGATAANPFPTPADVDTFVTNYMDPLFMGAGWSDWSSASDQRISSRIALNDKIDTSVTANTSGIRKLVMASAIVSESLSIDMDEDTRERLIGNVVTMVGGALNDLTQLRAETGLAQSRVTEASERMAAQAHIFEKHLLKMEGVDPYEAATRANDLLGDIEASYALTARIQQLSLLKFIS